MTDVRLTATNPEDSSVVPVACNDKGELKLEEPVEFDGNLTGDLNVSGSMNGATATVTGNVLAAGNQIELAANGVIGCGGFVIGSVIEMSGSGGAGFASDKAGFTAAGELVFTSRGTRWKATVSNGLVSAEEYTVEQQVRDEALHLADQDQE